MFSYKAYPFVKHTVKTIPLQTHFYFRRWYATQLPKMSTKRVQCGLVGLPNVGKSTIFNALGTGIKAKAGNYPFCTIEPNIGICEVPDKRLFLLADIYKPQNVVPAAMRFVDIAGLVKNASKGAGLGNKFLSHIAQVDAICHVVRCFETECKEISHVSGSVDPIRDVDIIETELILKDIETCEKMIAKLEPMVKRDKNLQKKLEFMNTIKDFLYSGKIANDYKCTNKLEEQYLKEMQLLTKKPMIFVANTDEQNADNAILRAMRDYAKDRNRVLVEICGELEAQVAEIGNQQEREEFLKQYGLDEPGLFKLVRAAYQMLDLITFFTAGPVEVRAWQCAVGTKAPKAAGKIHSDFEKGFIRAEVTPFKYYEKYKSEKIIKQKGKVQVVGKEYVIQDGDVVYFRTNC